MNEITRISATCAQTMTSREIAELVESTHPDVKRSIERLAAKGVIAIPPSAGYLDSLGRAGQTEYLIGKRDSYVIVAQLSPEFTARLVDRWQELEAGALPALPRTFSEALRALADKTDLAEQQAAALALAAPKVEFVDRYVNGTGTKTFREVCKLLGAKENAFRSFLAGNGVMYRINGSWMPYASHIDAGRFVVKTGVAESNGHAFNTAKWTAKGVEWVAGEWAKHQIRSEVVASD